MSAFDVKSLRGITQDSRAVKSGYLFAALPGSKFDGRDYIETAIRHGAVAILAPEGTVLPEGSKDVTLITDQNTRIALARMAAEFYGKQPERIVAVTGTNGKTSTAHFTQQIWQKLGLKSASLGTLGVRSENTVRSGSLTTPDPVSLQAELADLAAAGITHLAMEASSHGLDQYRLDGAQVTVAGFTNLSRDHLDYHETMDKYFAAKLRLFTDLLAEEGVAVLNADEEHYNSLNHAIQERGSIVELSYGVQGKDIKLLEVTPTAHGQHLKIEVIGRGYEFTLPLVGDFQVMNVLCALGLVIAEFPDDKAQIDEAVETLSSLEGVPGRLQLVRGFDDQPAVYIDYAHTPDALKTILKALRPHTSGRLVCLFGCGGDRDKGKRSMMAQVAGEFADDVIVTDDNPRSEDPAVIRREILAGFSSAKEDSSRRDAICGAIKDLQKADVLVIAGKGHEHGQIFASRTEPFDDYTEAEKVLEEIKSA